MALQKKDYGGYDLREQEDGSWLILQHGRPIKCEPTEAAAKAVVDARNAARPA